MTCHLVRLDLDCIVSRIHRPIAAIIVVVVVVVVASAAVVKMRLILKGNTTNQRNGSFRLQG